MSENACSFTGKVADGCLHFGVWLGEAGERYGNFVAVEQAHKAQAAFASMPPESDARRMPHGSDASEVQVAEWRCNATQLAAWTDIAGKLFFGELIAYGSPGNPIADPEWIPVQAWYFLRRDERHENVVRGEGLSYFYVRVMRRLEVTGSAGLVPEDQALSIGIHPRPEPQFAKADEVQVLEALRPVDLRWHAGTTAKSKRGPKGDLTKRTAAAILAHLQSGEINPDTLTTEGQEALLARYPDVRSRDTVMKAWQSAMLSYNSNN